MPKLTMGTVGLGLLFVMFLAAPIYMLRSRSQGSGKVPLPMGCPSFTEVSNRFIRVKWPAAKQGAVYQVQKYELYMKKGTDQFGMVYSGTKREFKVENLSVNTNHTFALLSVNKHGASHWGCMKSVLTGSNAIENPSFEVEGRTLLPYPTLESKEQDVLHKWEPFHWGYSIDDNEHDCHSGEKCLRFEGNADTEMYGETTFIFGATQLVVLDQTEATPLTLSAWAKAEDVSGEPGKGYGVAMDIKYMDGTSLIGQEIYFETGTHNWHAKCVVVEELKPIHSVVVSVNVADRSGTMFFDDVSLVPGEGIDPETGSPCRSRCVFGPRTKGDCYRVEQMYRKAEDDPDPYDISIISQLSVDRLVRLREMAKLWDGPLSATVYIKDPASDLQAIEDLRNSIAAVEKNVDFHILYSDKGPYPINTLRNVAIQHSRTKYVFLLDVDFIPNPNMLEYVRELRHLMAGKKQVLVVPAFEMLDMEFGLPGDKNSLLHLEKYGKLQQVHQFYAPAHAPTNYTRWYDDDEIYEAVYSLNYEPYLIGEKTMPWYDERFVGYGHDKSSHAYELAKAGYKFFVLPEAFVIHIDHGVPKWREQRDLTRIWRNWYDFVFDLEVKYGPTVPSDEKVVRRARAADEDEEEEDEEEDERHQELDNLYD
eukprot:GFYU01002971.1.p1 GENE.GFYU01002971.1~~GFYU01002971.1.p1  ORF type:complete len:649 (+),score=146.51 GFYU01002971.1:144-2090(+)